MVVLLFGAALLILLVAMLATALLPAPLAARLADQQALVYLTAGILLAVVLLLYDRLRQFHHQEQLAIETAELAMKAEQGRAHAAELAALVRFSQALSFCTDEDALRRTVLEELPRLTGNQQFWLRTRPSGAEIVIAPDSAADGFPAGPEAWETFPLMAGHRDIGVLGVRHEADPLSEGQRHLIELAAMILAVSVRNVQLFKRIGDFSMFDALTGCLTKRQGLDAFAAQMRRAQRTGAPLSLLLLQIDDFDAFNQSYGVGVGDQVLAQLGRLFAGELRSSDLRCRYGGATFAFMLPDTSLVGALRAANDLRQKAAAVSVLVEGEPVAVTVSIGVAEALPGEGEPVALLRRADGGLKKVQHGGGNAVAVGTAPSVGSAARR